MKAWKVASKGVAAVLMFCSRRRLLHRFNRVGLVGKLVLGLLFFTFTLISLLALKFLIVCEIPKRWNNVLSQRSVEEKEFWPYSITMADAAGIISNLTAGYPTSIKPVNFKYTKIPFLWNSVKTCKHDAKYDIIILIKTALRNEEQRSIIRSSWANKNFLSNLHTRVKYAFLIGTSESMDIESKAALVQEIDLHRDFIIGDFEDTYRNLTMKVMMGLRWVEEHCSKYEFVVFVDDDMELHLINFVKLLRDPENYSKSSYQDRMRRKSFSKVCQGGCKHFYAGYTLPHYFFPERSLKSKMYITKDDYPHDFYPLYATGLIMILSKKTATSMNLLSSFVPHVSIEDLFLGLLAKKLNIKPFDISQLITTAFNSERLLLDFWKYPEIAIGKTQHYFGCD